jgi:pyrrolidone-carboxylate peptidase
VRSLSGCLITGFEPFGQHLRNPSGEAAQLLADSGAITAVLPVDFFLARDALLNLLESHRPHTCLCTGVCLDESYRMETQARKVAEFADLPGPELLVGTWDFDALPDHVGLSADAGAYVCESTYWTLLNFRAERAYPARAAFLHVPPIAIANSAQTAAVIAALLLAC